MNFEELKKRIQKLPKKTLVEELLAIADRDDMVAKHLQQITSTEDEAAKLFRQRIAGLKRQRRFIHYRDSFDFARELEQLLDGLQQTIADPKEGFSLVVSFLKTGNSVFERCDDSSGSIGDVYRLTATNLFAHYGTQLQDEPRVAKLLVELMAETDSDIHPVLIAGIAQFQLVHIHPFVDGNGRTSRLLSTLCLYRAGYDFKRLFTISEYYDRNREAFYSALQQVRENDMDLTGWLDYFTEGLATQLDEVKSAGTHAIQADVIAKKHTINARQTAAIEYLLVQGRLTIAEFESLCPATNRRTLQRDLKSMLDKGLLEEVGAGSTDPTRYYKILEL